jgi:hypothetical protein
MPRSRHHPPSRVGIPRALRALLMGASLTLAMLAVWTLVASGGAVASAAACGVAPDSDCRPPRAVPVPESPPRSLATCGPWSDPVEGGPDGGPHVWRIDDVPTGATFDLRLEGGGGPVRVIVAYPVGSEIFDSGWDRLGAGDDVAAESTPVELHDLFWKVDAVAVELTVRTSAAPARWTYQLRCRWP